MKDQKTAQKLLRRYRDIASRIAATGPILQGTITERIITREQKDRRGVAKTYGPYYQWTFKKEGKTVTVNLSAQQVKLFQEAIENNRKLEKTLTEMRRLSLQICEASTEGVKRRKRSKPLQSA